MVSKFCVQIWMSLGWYSPMLKITLYKQWKDKEKQKIGESFFFDQNAITSCNQLYTINLLKYTVYTMFLVVTFVPL
jgi:hypothetical protein